MSILDLSLNEIDPNLVVKKNHLTARANEMEYGQELDSLKPLFEADIDEIN